MAAKCIRTIDLDTLDKVSGGSPCRGYSGARYAPYRASSYYGDVDFGGPSPSAWRSYGGYYDGGFYGASTYRGSGWPYGSYQDMALSSNYVVDDTGWG